jgi:hypothetical protein
LQKGSEIEFLVLELTVYGDSNRLGQDESITANKSWNKTEWVDLEVFSGLLAPGFNLFDIELVLFGDGPDGNRSGVILIS